ncbi:FHA domain-containing protein [Diaminobutyricibacter tongyongensis]|uniref:FHA domain-containing protein n=1 Tax=Leifsonia tongyongensis TaxID=1268043 RepID=A0A6L9Y172_9MICO|nr:FHA domain-containing protein [Diaminobutyricibacter tongyongensis]
MTPGYTRYAPSAGRSKWHFVSGRTFVAVFDSTASDSVVDALWWLAESDLATIESVVGAFPLVGDDAVRSFAAATIAVQHETGEGHVTAVVRGSACIDVFSVGGSRRFSARGTQPWVLAEFRSVIGLVLGDDDHPTGPVATAARGALPLGTGVVDGELLVWSTHPIERVDEPAEAAPHARPQPESVAPAPAEGETDETVIRPKRVPPPVVDVVTAAIPLPTMNDSVRAGRRAVLAQAPDGVLGFRVGSADPIDLDLPVLIGRSPRPPRVFAGVEPRLIEVESRQQQVSSTHVQLEQVGDTVVVTDLRSTNGTLVSSREGLQSRLKPGESIVVLPGARVDIGDGNIIEITPARDEP